MMKLFLAGIVVTGSSMSWWAWQQDPAPVGEATAPQDSQPAIPSGVYSVIRPPGEIPTPAVQQSWAPAMVTSGVPGGLMETTFYPTASQPSDPTAADLHKAMEKYREAGEGSPERDTLRTEIAELLGKQYDHLLSQHEEQVVELESRLTKLREQLDRRQAAKDKLVELKLEMVLSQAEGLGWPEAPRTSGYYSAPSQPGFAPTPAGVPGLPSNFLPATGGRPQGAAGGRSGMPGGTGGRSGMSGGAGGRSSIPATRPTPPPVPANEGEDEGAGGDTPISPPSVPQ